MTFLALTGFQAALLALITAGAIVALYFLKLRHRRMVVASSLLWARVLDERQAQSLWEKLRRVISIAAAVLIGLLIAMAVGRPEMHWLTGGGERTLLVLDTSPSMLARTRDGSTRWQHAVTAALRTVNASAPSSEFRVADTIGRVDAAPTTDRREIREAIERMKPIAGTARFPESDSETAHVRFITDGVVPLPMPKGAVRESVFEEAENKNSKDHRFRVEHAQHLTQLAIPRFAQLKVIASMQPYHAIDDGRWAYKRLDDERLIRTYAFKSLLEAKAKLTFGSDWTVAPLKPLQGIYAAVTRRTLDDKNPHGWYPGQKISVEQALRCYTANNAYAGFQENKLGILKKGMLADLVVLDENIFDIAPEKINDVKVLRTIVNGKQVYLRK